MPEDPIGRFAGTLADHLPDTPTLTLPLWPRSVFCLLAWATARRQPHPVVCVTDGPQTLEGLHRDMLTLMPAALNPASLLYFPARESPAATAATDPDLLGYRFDALRALSPDAAPPATRVVVTCIQALMQHTLTPAQLAGRILSLHVNQALDMHDASVLAMGLGYDFVTEVDDKGQAARKGGLLDIWPVSAAYPLRVEFMGATVETIRTFDPATQRSIDRVDTVTIPPAVESAAPGAPPLDYFPPGSRFAWWDTPAIRAHAAILEQANHAPARVTPFAAVHTAITERAGNQVFFDDQAQPDEIPIRVAPVPRVFRMPRDIMEPDLMDQARRRLAADLQARAAAGDTVILFFDTEGSRDRFADAVDLPARGRKRIHTRPGILSEGFICDTAGLVVVAEADLSGFEKRLGRRYDPSGGKARAARQTGERITSLTNIEPGDLVVHIDHGLGRYQGLSEIVFDGRRQEVLSIEYDAGARLHLPVSQAHVLSRYVGASARHQPRLNRLGGRRWKAQKEAAESAIADLAASLLETQAHRNLLTGHAFPADTPWQHDFESAFPYRETVDQESVIADVKTDMQSPHPMDRLVCGDAGYGKTEVAIRAAFKTVMAQKQVAVLVPTTVLAQQHYDTFRERMNAYPIRVEMLSRFCTGTQRATILKGMADGTADIVIGTHALVQPGVQFKDLGLVVIDEEQRFGVVHKEQLKEMRRLVDVLTLTATPIPRTLYMSMTGARDMSLLQTPPLERMAIQTIVTRNTDEVIREAILREMNREGQVFFLHNRVMTIARVQHRLQHLVPAARIAVAHGQMGSRELSAVMHRFVAGDIDVLLCTTIIESGMDIPRANTILIDRADRFGIADLYQLRGRVGRSSHKAYAYLLLPPHGNVDPDARKRIGAVQKFSGLGAGFHLALRDLEIRGAGNLLGAAQSGHITAIGFGLYCQLLRRTVDQLKGRTPAPVVEVDLRLDFIDLAADSGRPDHAAAIPYTYVEDEGLRVDLYRRIASTVTRAELAVLRKELRDRFGPPPPPVDRLLRLAALRLLCAARKIRRVEVRDLRVRMMRHGEFLTQNGRFPRLTDAPPDTLLSQLESLLKST